MTVTARDAAVLTPPAIVGGRARAVRASAGSNAAGAVAVAEVVVRIVGLEEAEVAVDGVVRARHLVLTAVGSMRALTVANGPTAKRTKTLDSGNGIVYGDDDAITGSVAGEDHMAVHVVRRLRGGDGLIGLGRPDGGTFFISYFFNTLPRKKGTLCHWR